MPIYLLWQQSALNELGEGALVSGAAVAAHAASVTGFCEVRLFAPRWAGGCTACGRPHGCVYG